MTEWLVFTQERCKPCKQLWDYLNDQGVLDAFTFKYLHNDKNLFDALAIRSTPTLVKELNLNEYQIRAVGLPDILNYLSGYTGEEEE